MEYNQGDIVRFKVGHDELHLGEVQFIEKTDNGSLLYINSFSGWAYKVRENMIIAPRHKKLNLIPRLEKSYLTRGVGLYRGETLVSP